MRHLLLLLPVAACTMTTPAAAPPPSAAARLAAECALLASAASAMSGAGTPADAGLREGCPGETARDTRPLARQTESLRTAYGAALPPGVVPGSRGEAVYRRMITRGVPPAIALQLAAGPEFAAAAR